MDREPTDFTSKLGLGLTVGFCRIPAMAAFPAGIPGVDKLNRDSCQFCLVDNKTAEFKKSPLAESFALIFSNRCPEALEVFKYDASLGVLCNLNDFFRNGVIGGAFESSLSTREFFKMSLCRTRAFLLKVFFEGVHFYSDIINRFTRKRLSVRSGSKIDNTKIDTKLAFGVKRFSVGKFNTKAEIENPLDIQQVGLASNSPLIEFGIGTENDGDLEPSIKTEDRDRIEVLKGKNPAIVDNSRMLLKDMKTFLLSPVRLCNFSDGPDGKLSRKTIPLPDNRIDEMVESDLPELLLLESNSGDVVAGCVKDLNSLYQRGCLLSIGEELDLNYELHKHIVINLQYKVKKKRKECVL